MAAKSTGFGVQQAWIKILGLPLLYPSRLRICTVEAMISISQDWGKDLKSVHTPSPEEMGALTPSLLCCVLSHLNAFAQATFSNWNGIHSAFTSIIFNYSNSSRFNSNNSPATESNLKKGIFLSSDIILWSHHYFHPSSYSSRCVHMSPRLDSGSSAAWPASTCLQSPAHSEGFRNQILYVVHT